MDNCSGIRKNTKSSFLSQQIAGGDASPHSRQSDASLLIGRIVEKGIREESIPFAATPLPKPTVLPFPVARHRSHGPHWAPLSIAKNVSSQNAYAVVDKEQEGDCAEFDDVVRVFANPLQKSKRKNIDFTSWRELCSADSSSLSCNQEEHISVFPEFEEREKDVKASEFVSGESKSCEQKYMDMDSRVSFHETSINTEKGILERRISNLSAGVITESLPEFAEGAALSNFTKNEQQMSTDKRKYSTSKLSDLKSNDFKSEQGLTGLKSQIDAENLARLQRMSPDEITETRAEIMEKYDPVLLKLLQRRSQDKSKKQIFSTSEFDPISKSHDLPNDNLKPTLKDTKKLLDDSEQDVIFTDSILWNAWNERVEGIRRLRFSLDGSVIEDFLCDISETSNNICCDSGYSDVNVSERDFLRTEGNPGAAGYTIKEAVTLTRSVIPGQRTLALHLLAAVLDKALHNIYQNVEKVDSSIDWKAVWAFALGPEPELILSLRMCLDDNHTSVVLACARVIQCILCCEMNEDYFSVFEKVSLYEKDICTAPVFRARPEIDFGFLHGGFWKYSAKPSNILPFNGDTLVDESEEKHTIQDDIFVSGQDIAAGLVRMGILPRMCYLLETDPTATLEECILSILISVARHSPTCANAIKKCERLLGTVVNRFTKKVKTPINPSMIKSVTLLKVVARYHRMNCFEFIENGIFSDITWHLDQQVFSIEHLLTIEKENSKLASALMVEQFRFWKVFIQFGYSVSYFERFSSALTLWLNPSTFEKLIHHNILTEFADIFMEAYLLLGALCKTLPSFCSQNYENMEVAPGHTETWSWSQVDPIIDVAVKWMVAKSNPCMLTIVWQKNQCNLLLSSLLWIFSSVMHMFSCLLESLLLEYRGDVPEFIAKIGVEFMKIECFRFLDADNLGTGTSCSFIARLSHLRRQSDFTVSLSSVCCLHGLVRVSTLFDKLKAKTTVTPFLSNCYARGDEILADVISGDELRGLVVTFINLICSEWHCMQGIEAYGRGGPSPGVGFGWGSSGGGFWSKTVLLTQVDASLLVMLLNHLPLVEEMTFNMEKINALLCVCLALGPSDQGAMEAAFDILFQVPVIEQLGHFSHRFTWQFVEDDYLRFSKLLAFHFKNRWLRERKKKSHVDSKPFKKASSNSLGTILEDVEMSDTNCRVPNYTSLVVQWAYQRLPLPLHWVLSPMSTISKEIPNTIQVARAGLFFLLGIEGMCSFLPANAHSPVQHVPLIWKLHSLSMILLPGMDVLEDEKSRDIYEALQQLYGQSIHSLSNKTSTELTVANNVEFLRFKAEIHETYCTFVETFVDQFAAISYGDCLFGRQVAIYLHRRVESQLRLSAWNALSNTHALELLPPLENCLGEAQGYLEPLEDNELVLEAYAKSWVCGGLDRARIRGSITFTLALHHLSIFIFSRPSDSLMLRNKLVKSLLRDYSRKPEHKGMMLDLIEHGAEDGEAEMERRFGVLVDACDGNSSLLNEVGDLVLIVGK